MKRNSKKGFTLVELLVTITLLTVIGALCFTIIFMGLKNAQKNSKETAFQSGANLLIANLNSDINYSKNGSVVVQTPNSSTIVVKIIDSQTGVTSTHTYSFDSSAKKVTYGTGSNALSFPYIKNAVFTYSDSLLNIKLQCDLDDKWLETSFYIK